MAENSTRPNTTEYKLRLSLINKEGIPEGAHRGATRRVNNNTKKKHPCDDIVDRIMAKIESKMKAASLQRKTPICNDNVPKDSNDDSAQADPPNTEHKQEQSEDPTDHTTTTKYIPGTCETPQEGPINTAGKGTKVVFHAP